MKRLLPLIFVLVLPAAAGCAQEAPQTDVASATPFAWPSFDEAITSAAESQKPILIDIYAPWCGWCRRMQEEVYGNRMLAAFVRENFEYGRLNLDDSQTEHSFREYVLSSQELGYALGAQGTPTTVFMESNGDYITKLDGYWALEPFGKAVRYIASGAYEEMTFERYVAGTDS